MLNNVNQQYQVNNLLISVDYGSSESSDIFASDKDQDDSPLDMKRHSSGLQAFAQAYEEQKKPAVAAMTEQERLDRIASAMKDESQDSVWSLEKASERASENKSNPEAH